MKKYAWLLIIIVVATLVYLRTTTEIISKHYIEELPSQGTVTLRGTFDKEGNITGSGEIEHNGELRKSVQASIRGDALMDGSVDNVSGSLALDNFHFGFWSLVPAALTIVLAFLTRQVILSLFVGILAGGLVSGQFDIVSAYLLPSIGTSKYAQILLIYLWCLGGLIGLWSRTGGAIRFATWAAEHLVRGPKTAKLFAYIMGIVFHQGGTISTVLAGTTVKPICDEERVSHEELSYIIDSTASPVATLIPLNVWPAFTAAFIVGTAPYLSTLEESITFFMKAIPFNFYALFAILLTLATSMEWLPWYGGRMTKAMKRARETGRLDSRNAEPMTSKELTSVNVPDFYKPSIADFLVPLGTLICVAGIPLFFTGSIWVNQAFFVALIVGMFLAMVRGMPLNMVLDSFIDGIKGVTIGAVILALAVTLGDVSASLGTANYIVMTLGGALPALILPAVFLVICMLISFSTGSSWGTYAVVLPLAMPLAVEVSQTMANPEFFVLICFGALIGGAVFGDNCSPISDTTILSSVATGCDLMDHVYTQLPLAMLAAISGGVLYTILAFFMM